MPTSPVSSVADARAEPVTLEPSALAAAFGYATDWLAVYVEEVDALNVFPVPDGDTGTNMHLTMQSVRRQLEQEDSSTMASFAHALSYGSLLGARGNSGVILSQVLKGFADVARKSESLDAAATVAALDGATRSAYAAVMKPVEGTILTVMREAAAGAGASGSNRPLAVLRSALDAGRLALERTPEQLPLLKEAGVVDAGGLGLLKIFEGILAHFEGRRLPPRPEVKARAQQQFAEEDFGFCTEFLLAEVTVPIETIRDLVQPFGDSLLVVGAEGFVKGHIHTEEPEQLLANVARHGRMVRSKVEDMSEQHSEILATVDLEAVQAPVSGIVAVSDGYGVTKVFRSLGARVVGGGQTNNPSVQDIADAVRSVGASEVLVLPNNKNIILGAERVDELLPELSVRVLPTRSIGQGLAAAVQFRSDRPLDEQLDDLNEAAQAAHTAEVTVASRTASVDGIAVVEGEHIGLLDGVLRVSGGTAGECLAALLDELDGEAEIGTLFYSSTEGAGAAEAVAEALNERFEDLEVELQPGAPDLYPYVMALE
jgi:DAK2 domain fusion protein YloV